MTERDIFDAALQISGEAARAAYLRQACGGDDRLRDQISGLLRAEQLLGNFLAEPLTTSAWSIDTSPGAPVLEGPAMQIGPYKLLEQIGEGGMGAVHLAEQAAPVRRKVALKIIKPGMDTREVIARFEAERQALALMDHPNIASVFDGGTTDAGRPYFVMELVRGVPITDYCDQSNVAVHERLELFVTVCHAVQHAHQKGIIHRDLKPSNVLVTLHDGRPVPKVIDFGVAKAIGERLTDKTLVTQFPQLIGTPLYMSPEQTEMAGRDIDTRADIYSLGVLLYELLTGTTPFERGRMMQVAFDEVRRIIREDEPPKPSTRLSELGRSGLRGRASDSNSAVRPEGPTREPAGTSLASVAALRKMEPHKLSQMVRGDLDWIVMKALEKDRTRRYETANGLALDIQRYLLDEPVEARPPSSVYLFRKFARRNRGFLTATALVVVGLIAAVVTLGISNTMIRDEQARTRSERARAVLAQQTAEDRAEQLRQGVLDLQAAHRLVDQGRTFLEGQRWDDAESSFSRAIELRPEYPGPWDARSDLYIRLGLFDLAVLDLNRAYEFHQPVNWRWMALALLRLNAGDVAGWRDARVSIRQQTHVSAAREFDVDAARVAVQYADPESDPHDTVEMGESFVNREPANPFLHYLLGLAYYRAGQFENSANELHAAATMAPGWAARRIALPGLAMALHRLGRDAEARRTLDDAARAIDEWTRQICETNNDNWAIHQSVGNWPIPWWDWLECRVFYREAGLLIDGAAPLEDPRLHLIRARAFQGLRRTGLAIQEFDAALAGLPNDPQIQFERFRARGYYFSYRDWPQAAIAFGEARRIVPDQSRIWNFEAVSQLAAGDLTAYRQLCTAMCERFEGSQDRNCADDVVYACVLRPDALPEPARLIPVAKVTARLNYGHSRVLGAACYRAGQYHEAVQQFDEAARCYRLQAWELCFEGMAHFRLGDVDRARGCLRDAAAWIAEADQPASSDLQERQNVWGGLTQRFEVGLLYAEASALIDAAAAGDAASSGEKD